ncbi:MAG: hypothetical protein IPN33_18505 [Saprospiraceae bacterium]|nr:hypothetical protein [Saprospiraceae bacterium]
MAAFNGALPNPLLSKIYVFDNEDGGDINIQFPILPSGAKGFVFRCDCGTMNNPDGCDQIYLGPADMMYTNMPAGFYYIAILGGNTGDFGITVFPTSICPTSTGTLESGIPVNDVLGQNSSMSVANGDYELCYNGVRSYEGGESFHNFRIDYPTGVNIEANSPEPIGLFLFSYLCGRTCIAYAENNPPESDTAALLNIQLPIGEYFIVLDRDLGLSPQNRSETLPPDNPFTLSYNNPAVDTTPSDLPILSTYNLGNAASCPVDT